MVAATEQLYQALLDGRTEVSALATGEFACKSASPARLVASPAQDAVVTACTVETICDERSISCGSQREWNDARRSRADRASVPLVTNGCAPGGTASAADAQLHIIVVRARGQIIAIAPLMWERPRMYGMPVRRLRLLQNDHTPRADFIVAEPRPDEAYRAIWTRCVTTRRNWDVLQLSQLPRRDVDRAALTALGRRTAARPASGEQRSSPYLSIDRNWERTTSPACRPSFVRTSKPDDAADASWGSRRSRSSRLVGHSRGGATMRCGWRRRAGSATQARRFPRDPAVAPVLHEARRTGGGSRVAAAAVPHRRRPPHRHLVLDPVTTTACFSSRPATTRSSTRARRSSC